MPLPSSEPRVHLARAHSKRPETPLPRAHTSRSLIVNSPFSILHFLGLLVVLAWLLRNSVATYYVPTATVTFTCYTVLLACISTLLTSPLRLLRPGCILLLAALPGSFWSAEPNVTLPRYAGWALLVTIVGPVVTSPTLRELRNTAWRSLRLALPVIGLTSCAWWLLGLPVMGRGDFTGVMNHSNLLGPLAGMGCVLLLNRWLASSSSALFTLAGTFACLLASLASGSRLAIISLTVATACLLWLYQRTSKRSLYLTISVGLTGAILFAFAALEPRPLTAVLHSKGWQNTRNHLWTARWAEFKAHPQFGTGIGTAEGDGLERDLAGRVNVEPGSSYLAVLSMTGVTGAVAFAFMTSTLVRAFRQGRDRLSLESFSELLVIGLFLAVHAFGEGWIFAVGSPLALIFWLWTGHLSDQLSFSQTQPRPPRLRPGPQWPEPQAKP